jgi:hypothetical protein
MSSNRNRTVRRNTTHDLSANVIDFAVNESLERLINTEIETAYRRPWHRLDRGLRLNRLRLFVDDLATKRGLKPQEKAALLTLLSKSLDKKLLNSKVAVDYDPETERILEIKPLVMHQSATGEVLFQLLEKRNAVTFRKRSSAPAAASAAAPGKASGEALAPAEAAGAEAEA